MAEEQRQRSRSRSPSKGKKKSAGRHKKIDRDHPEFELTYDMMLAVRTTVSKVESKPPRPLVLEDFTAVTKHRFLSGGTADTPAHQMRDFKFKDYAPEVFRHIRAKFGISPTEYLLNVCGEFDLLEFISNSKSGSFFFYTQNGQYLIKTIDKAESKKLRYILPAYYHHVMRYENTLLTRFYGMHRVKPHKKKMVHFLVFGSVFHRSLYIHNTYDLKGSSLGRSATAEEKAGGDQCVHKDNDFIEKKAKIRVGPARAKVLKDQIERDVEFLRQLEIMDYSLLLGIHDGRKPVPGQGPKVSPRRRRTGGPDFLRAKTAPHRERGASGGAAPAAEQRPGGGAEAAGAGAERQDDAEREEKAADAAAAAGAGKEADEADEDEAEAEAEAAEAGDEVPEAADEEQRRPRRAMSLTSHERRQSHYGLPAFYDKLSYPDDGHFVAPEFEPLNIPEHKENALPPEAAPHAAQESVFTADDGGIRGCDADGRPNGEVYYMGVIDILTVYSAKKKVEHFGKALKYDKESISCVKPTAYARRFKEFLNAAIE